ncbi:ribonuclease R [Gudongella sp. DL1XJH-153]|uniref:ribonuclease R n=1 Tax=Gudongella sp. DL1XJH-153 TaxID=3409804 RepID=UPI003BB6339A
MILREEIIKLMESKKYKPLLKEELAARFNIGKKEQKDFFKILDDMEKEGLILKARNDRYGLINPEFLVIGRLEGNEKGFGFVISKDRPGEDIFIPADSMNTAMHGDKVVANLIKGRQEGRKQEGRKQEGEVIRVLERANESVIGTYEDSGNFGFVIPDNHKIAYDIFIPKGKTLKAKDGQKVVVGIEKWPEFRRNPEGSVIEILGYLTDKGTDILSIIRQFKLPEEFPEEVRADALKVPSVIDDQEIRNRKDLRELNIFTIDGADAKDLDDAISIEKLQNGKFRLGVHIADVTHYVRPGTQLDKEALKRGNSVYLLDRVIPMLPHELSNGICSLNPNVDRLTMTVFMDIDKNGKVVYHEIHESIINSKARLVYDDVSDLLEGTDEKAAEKLALVADDIFLMKELMDILRRHRDKRGSIDFDFPETYIELDEDGKPVDVRKRDRRIANRLIEEFMLVTNETVAERFFWEEIPFLYRIHEEPKSERVEDFQKFIHNFGYSMKGKELHPKDFQILTQEIKGKREEPVISTLLLRTMQKAIYSAEPGIHFGLAAQYYSHFTSPIRRYPDLQIHRIIKDSLHGQLSEKKLNLLEGLLPEIAEHTSMTERRAEEAEREVDDLKKAQYMAERIGEEYEGLVSSVTSFGLFVQLENTIEGLVHFSNMVDDFYFFDEDNYMIVGERTKKAYRLGDPVRIKVIGADIGKKNIDFQLINEEVDTED